MSVWDRIREVLDVKGRVDGLVRLLDPDRWLPGGREAAFTVALVALVAKMAVADGVVSRSEERAFRAMVQVAPDSEEQVAWFFDLAKQDVVGFDSYARKVERLFHESPETLHHVLDVLFTIAAADGLIHEDELNCLRVAGDIFGFTEEEFEQVAAQHIIGDGTSDPYLVLGIEHDVTDDAVRSAYRGLVREYHPDRLISRGVPEELMGMATAKMAAINSAYEAILKQRGLKTVQT